MNDHAKVRKQVTPHAIRRRKGGKAPISIVTAYDYPAARWADIAEIDVVFVSDAFASVGLGRENTFSVTVDEVIYHTQAVKNGSGNCLVLASMPFLSHTTPAEAVKNASRLVKEGGAHAVEIEGSHSAVDVVEAVADAGIPVVAHIGLTKYIASQTGHYRIQGKTRDSAIQIINDALAFEKAGAFALILECIPDRVAELLTEKSKIPTIGFGAGPHCDGQALVSQDLLGIFDKFCPKFVKQYAQLSKTAEGAFSAFRWEIANGQFPKPEHCIAIEDTVFEEVKVHFEAVDSNGLISYRRTI